MLWDAHVCGHDCQKTKFYLLRKVIDQARDAILLFILHFMFHSFKDDILMTNNINDFLKFHFTI